MYPIPANATRIRYLGSTGTQYVDTGVMAGPNTRSETDIAVTWGSNTVLALSGCGTSRHTFGRDWASSPRNANFYIGLGGTNYDTGVLLSSLSGRHTYWIDATLGKGGFDDTEFSISATVSENEFTSLLLAQRQTATAIRGQMTARLYGCRYYQSGVLVRDFVPVRIGQTGYLFDRVSGQLFGNAGTGDFVLGPDTFQQGVIPTRMMVAGVRKKARPPTVFNYIGVKIVACRKMRNCASLSAYRSAGSNMMQMSEFQILDANNSRYTLPSDATFSMRTAYNGERHYSEPVLVSSLNSGELVGRLFDGNTSTKWATYRYWGQRPVYDFDTGTILVASGESYDSAFIEGHFGIANDSPLPSGLVINVSSSPLDLSTYTQWRLLNANDNASTTNRTIVEMEVLGSADGMTWWRLGISNNPNAINTNYAVVHSGNLVPRAGDIWSDLDMATRDWANGITVDNI